MVGFFFDNNVKILIVLKKNLMLLQDINTPHTMGEWTSHYIESCRLGLVEDYQPLGNSIVDNNVLIRASLNYAAKKSKRGLVIGSKKTLNYLKQYL